MRGAARRQAEARADGGDAKGEDFLSLLDLHHPIAGRVFHRQRQFLAVNRDAIGRDADVVFDIPDLDRPVGGRLEAAAELAIDPPRSEEHTSELQSLMRISYSVFCLKKKKTTSQKK